MPLVRSPYAASLLVNALAPLALGAAAWARRRGTRGARPLAALSLLAMLWGMSAVGRLGAPPDAGLTWLRCQAAFSLLAAGALLAFALRATRALTRAGDALWPLSAAPLLAGVGLAFGPVGGLALWREASVVTRLGASLTVGEPTAVGLAALAYRDLVAVAALAVLALGVARSGRGRRAPGLWTLVGASLPLAADALGAVAAASPLRPLLGGVTVLPLGAFVLLPAALAAAYGLFSARGLRSGVPGPAGEAGLGAGSARVLLDRLELPVLRFDAGLRLTYLNRAARAFFPAGDELLGRTAETLFRDAPEVVAALSARREAVQEFAPSRSGPTLLFEARVAPLAEASGRAAGALVTLVDITRAHRAESGGEASDAALRRSVAALEGLQEALSAAARRRPLGVVLDVAVTAAARALDAPHAAIYVPDPVADALVRRAAVGGFEALDEPPLRRQEGLAGRVWEEARAMSAEQVPGPGEPGGAEPWAGAALAVPLRARDAGGVLMVARARSHREPFGPEDIEALQRFAALAAVAVEDAASRERLGQAEAELAWLDRIDAAVDREAPDTELLELTLSATKEAAGFDRAVVWLASPDGRALEASAWLGLESGAEASVRVPLDGSAPLLQEAFRGGREIVLEGGAPLPPRWRPSGPAAASPLVRAMRPAVLPLGGPEGVLGVLAADDRREGAELETRLRALRRIALRVGVALERARQRERMRCREAALRDADASLAAASEAREALLEALPAAYFETDLRGTLTRVSAELARLAGSDASVLRGVNLIDLSGPGADRALLEILGRVLRSGAVVRRASWSLRARRGGEVPAELSLGLLRDEEGEPEGYFGLLVPLRR